MTEIMKRRVSWDTESYGKGKELIANKERRTRLTVKRERGE